MREFSPLDEALCFSEDTTCWRKLVLRLNNSNVRDREYDLGRAPGP